MTGDLVDGERENNRGLGFFSIRDRVSETSSQAGFRPRKTVDGPGNYRAFNFTPGPFPEKRRVYKKESRRFPAGFSSSRKKTSYLALRAVFALTAFSVVRPAAFLVRVFFAFFAGAFAAVFFVAVFAISLFFLS